MKLKLVLLSLATLTVVPFAISQELPQCKVPSCSSDAERGILWPSCDPEKFYQCAPSGPVLMPCAEYQPGARLWFNFKQQVCNWPSLWEPACATCKQENEDERVEEEPSPPSNLDLPVCSIPSCETLEQRETLWPHCNPQVYWQCAPSAGHSWAAIERPCALEDTRFSFDLQVCVWPANWTQVCEGCGGIEPSTTANPTTSSSVTTTIVVTTTELPTQSSTSEATTEPIVPETSTELEITTESTDPSLPESSEPDTTTILTTTSEPTTEQPGPIDDPIGCDRPPACDLEKPDLKFATRDPQAYYECELHESGTFWTLHLRQCDGNLRFNYKAQDCVNPREWVDYCTPTEPSECGVPKCLPAERFLLFADYNPRQYWSCQTRGGVLLEPVLHECPIDRVFIYERQGCGQACDWVNPCSSGRIDPIYPEYPRTTDNSFEPRTTSSSTTEIELSSTTTILMTSTTTEAPLTTTEVPITTTEPLTTLTTTRTTASTTTAQPSTTTAKPQKCGPPNCYDEAQFKRRHPFPSPLHFYQCIKLPNDSREVQLTSCNEGTWFSGPHQVCVLPREWIDSC